ncbi:MAG: hypothetical protein Q8K37_01360, partial [Alphaproteobacteria bacterium]|nr:hypothetical protein [Alphaproteobacteria bacterium]
QDPFAGNEWNVVQVFYDLVSPNRLIQWIMEASETKDDIKDGEQYRSTPTNAPMRAQLKVKIEQNKKFRPFTVSELSAYLFNERLLSGANWSQYFTADPTEFFDSENDANISVLTRDGAKAILIHEGFLIEDPKN